MGILFEVAKTISKSAAKGFSEGFKEGYEMTADNQVRDAVAKASEFITGKKKKNDRNSFSFFDYEK